MDWDHYTSQYVEFLDAVECTTLATLAASRLLKNFPRALPSRLRAEITSGWRRLGTALQEAVTRIEKKEAWSESVSLTEIAGSSTQILLQRFLAGREMDPAKIAFERILLTQQLLSTIAYTEAFLNDSLRAIAIAAPGVLRREYNLSWKIVLDFKSSRALLQHMRDELVTKEFGGLSIRGRLAHLTERFGVEHGIAIAMLDRIQEAEEVRHIFVHNGGRVDRRFLEKTKMQGRPGRPYPLSRKYVAAAVEACTSASKDVFLSVSANHFNISASRLARYGGKVTSNGG